VALIESGVTHKNNGADMNEHLQTGKLEITDDLLSLPVHVGDAWQLQADRLGKQRYFAKLIGYLNQRSLIVMVFGADTLPAIGDGFSVRGFIGNKTYEFYSHVTGVSNSPYPHLHLDFPKQTQTRLMRRAIRVRTQLPAVASGLPSNLKATLVVSEISATGAGLSADVFLGTVGDYITLNFSIPSEGVDQFYNIPVVIRNVADAVDASYALQYGVEFVAVTDILRSALQEYLCVKLLGMDKPSSGFI